MSPPPPLRVAVVGSGLAGLTSAYLLATVPFLREDGTKLDVEVHLYEKGDALGMDASSISVKTEKGSFRVDTPMRSINSGSHHRVYSLYRHLRVQTLVSNFSYSFSRLQYAVKHRSADAPPPYSSGEGLALLGENQEPLTTTTTTTTTQTPLFIYEGSSGLHWPPLSFPSTVQSTLSKLLHLIHLAFLALSYFHLLLNCFLYYYLSLTTRAPTRATVIAGWLGFKNIGSEEMAGWCERHRIWGRMRQEVLDPLYAAVATVGRDEVGALPIGEIIDYIVGTFGSPHYVCTSGVQQVVRALTLPLPLASIHLSHGITSLSLPASGGTTLHFPSPVPSETFDHIIFATQANQALALLSTLSSPSSDCPKSSSSASRNSDLSKFKYMKSLVINHTDTSILPSSRTDWRDLNLVTFTTDSASNVSPGENLARESENLLPRSSVQATHVLSRTHPVLAKTLGMALGEEEEVVEVLQTTNPIVAIDEDRILSSTWYERAVVSVSGKSVLQSFILPPINDYSPVPSREKEKKTRGKYQGVEGIWFAGSWCAEGLPLLEGCVSSAERCVWEMMSREGGTALRPF